MFECRSTRKTAVPHSKSLISSRVRLIACRLPGPSKWALCRTNVCRDRFYTYLPAAGHTGFRASPHDRQQFNTQQLGTAVFGTKPLDSGRFFFTCSCLWRRYWEQRKCLATQRAVFAAMAGICNAVKWILLSPSNRRPRTELKQIERWWSTVYYIIWCTKLSDVLHYLMWPFKIRPPWLLPGKVIPVCLKTNTCDGWVTGL